MREGWNPVRGQEKGRAGEQFWTVTGNSPKRETYKRQNVGGRVSGRFIMKHCSYRNRAPETDCILLFLASELHVR